MEGLSSWAVALCCTWQARLTIDSASHQQGSGPVCLNKPLSSIQYRLHRTPALIYWIPSDGCHWSISNGFAQFNELFRPSPSLNHNSVYPFYQRPGFRVRQRYNQQATSSNPTTTTCHLKHFSQEHYCTTQGFVRSFDCKQLLQACSAFGIVQI